MSSVTRIEQALLGLDGAAYQKLCDVYLRREGYADLEPFGSRPGANKTRTGTPDSYATLPDGRFVLVECTTQQERTFDKLAGDLEKCLDIEATGVPTSQIAEVILCHTGRLAPEERAALLARAKAADVLVRPISLEQLAYDLFSRHQQIAYDMLGIELDTRQLLDVEDFVVAASASKFATTLDIPLRFREADLAASAAALEKGAVVLLTGHPGVGKTRLALEVCRTYQTAHPEAVVRCLFNRGLDLYRELQVLLAIQSPLLLFVDDANRYGGLDALLQLVEETRLRYAREEARVVSETGSTTATSLTPREPNGGSPATPANARKKPAKSVSSDASMERAEPRFVDGAAPVRHAVPGATCNGQPRVALLLTVRDYAREHVQLMLAARAGIGARVTDIEIPRLTDAQIADLLEATFGIRNGHFIERIQHVACGNPRLAMMAGRIAVDEQSLWSIRDVSALYDQYFESIRRDLGEIANRRPLLVAACIAFFRVVDREHEQQMRAIEQVFGVAPDEFWREATRLHEMELVDIHGDTAVKISDQVLGTYLFYFAVFRTRAVAPDVLLDGTFESFAARLQDALRGVLGAFDPEMIISALRPAVERRWIAVRERGDSDALDALMRSFWFVRPDETLTEIARWVTSLSGAPSSDGFFTELPATRAFSGVAADCVATNVVGSSGEALGSSGHIPGAPIRADQNARVPPRLELLTAFRTYSEDLTRLAVAVACDYLVKRPAESTGVLHLLTVGCGFHHDSELFGYVSESAVVEEVLRRAHGGDPLFSRVVIGVADAFLKIEFETTTSSDTSMVLRRFGLDAERGAKEIRDALWAALRDLAEQAQYALDVRAVLASYANGLRRPTASGEPTTRIVGGDAPHVLALVHGLNSATLEDCFLACEVIAALRKWGVRVPAAFARRFRTDDVVLAEHLYNWWAAERKGGWRAADHTHRAKLWQIVADLPAGDFGAFFGRLKRIHAAIEKTDRGRNDWFPQSRITALLRDVANRRSGDYVAVLDEYIAAGEPRAAQPAPLVDALIRVTSPADAYAYVLRLPEPQRSRWLGAYFSVLPADAATRELADRLVALYESAPLESLPTNPGVIERFRAAEPRMLVRVVSALVSRAEAEPTARRVLVWLLISVESAANVIREAFAEDAALLVRAYLVADDARDHFDHDAAIFSAATDLEPAFPLAYAAHIYNDRTSGHRFDDQRDYSRLWTRPDASALMLRLARHVLELEHGGLHWESWFARFFTGHEPGDAVVDAAQDAWLLETIDQYASDGELMELVFRATDGLPDGRRRSMFAAFLSRNTTFEAFESLPLEPRIQMAMGSWVPIEERRRTFLESLVPLCNRPPLVDHREFLLKRIDAHRKRIASEKKSDFLGKL